MKLIRSPIHLIKPYTLKLHLFYQVTWIGKGDQKRRGILRFVLQNPSFITNRTIVGIVFFLATDAHKCKQDNKYNFFHSKIIFYFTTFLYIFYNECQEEKNKKPIEK